MSSIPPSDSMDDVVIKEVIEKPIELPSKVANSPDVDKETKRRSVKKLLLKLEFAEVNWLFKKIEFAFKNAHSTVRLLDGRTDLSEAERDDLRIAKEHGPFLMELRRVFEGTLTKGSEIRNSIDSKKREYESVLEFADETDAKDAAKKALEELPEKVDFNLSTDRQMVKFFLRIIEADIEALRTRIIPYYEKAEAKVFDNPLLPRSYYINKSVQTKNTLMDLRKKLETIL